MKKIMIDMDDVIVGGGFLALLNKYMKTNYTEDLTKNFYLQQLVPEDRREDFLKYVLNENMYNYGEILPDAYNVLKKINQKYKLYIGTAYLFPELPFECGLLLSQKHNFLLENFPFLTPNNFVFVNDKSILDCEIKIDDRIHNLDGALKKILFTSYHNKNISLEELESKGIVRVNNWLDIEKLLIDAEN